MATVVLGAQWGDEGKGKLVDILCPQMKLVAAGQTYDFHILPSGLLNPDAKNLVGSGCVVHVPALFKELSDLEAKGLPNVRERLFISDRAHVVLDLHQKLDGLQEIELKGGKIGTTGKGIGPCYSTKASRSGIRIADVFNEELFEKKVRTLAAGFKKRFGDLLQYDPEEEITQFKIYREQLAPLVIDQLPLIISAQNAKTPILIEGANAIMLDIDAGTYPYVTSSNTGLGGIFTGLGGLNPKSVKSVIGVVKAYTTRVGSGPFPTEALDEYGNKLQEIGREFGVTTGRRRRCGWLDIPVVRYSAAVNSYTEINLTKLDILDTFPEIKVAVNYKDPQTKEVIQGFPADLSVVEHLEVEYLTMEGWMTPIGSCKSFYDLPKACRAYIEFIEKEVGVKISHIGVGPRREDMIIR
ncbi:MAG: hypothetical protein M1818_002284 [Claussenomyces sp. TS43310]|nr:MAG: hypothetical protein M1818_002284 [Claussenomyces sp. TS43310]